MFDFEKLSVYQKALFFTNRILDLLRKNYKIDLFLKDQLKRAAISITINIAEGSGRSTKPDKKNFYIIANASLYESVSLLQIIEKQYALIDGKELYDIATEISKMLYGLIRILK